MLSAPPQGPAGTMSSRAASSGGLAADMSAMPPTSNDTAGVLCRYADDLLVMCRTERAATNALDALTVILGELGLELKRAKTGSCTACCDESGCG